MEHNNILIKLRKIIRSINLESKKIQKEYGVSIPQVLCLSYLKDAPNYQSTQIEIRKYLNLNSSTVSGIINRLEKKGFVARLPKFGDKRVTNIALTSSGADLIKRVPPLMHEQLTTKLEIMKDEEIKQIVNGLELLINLFEINEIEASPMITVEDNIGAHI